MTYTFAIWMIRGCVEYFFMILLLMLCMIFKIVLFCNMELVSQTFQSNISLEISEIMIIILVAQYSK